MVEAKRSDNPSLGHGLAVRYLSYVIGALLTVLLGLSAVVIWLDLAKESKELADDARSQASFLGAVAPESVFLRDYLTLETLVRQTTEDPDVAYVVVVDAAGRPMTRYLDRDEPAIDNAVAGLDGGDTLTVAAVVQEASVMREIREPIISEGVQLGEVRLGYSLASARRQALHFAVQALVATVLLALILTALTALVFEWQIRRPLRRLFVAANALATGDLTERVDVTRSDEIGTVHQAFNEMAGELESTVATAHLAQEAAEGAARAKTEFLANMSHEIRTPLNAVLGLTEVVLGSELSAEQQDLLQTVHRSGTSLLGIINDILYLSKVEAGRLELEAEPLSLRHCVDDVGEMFAVAAEQKGIELRFGVDEGLPGHVVGDESRLRQVLVNLVGNAVKFTDEGEIEVQVRRSDSAAGVGNPGPGRGERLEFLVRDSGVGIEHDAIDRLFEPFSQADASTTRRYGGTGLGLTICRRLVGLMGGELTVTSTVGEGSCFSFTVSLPPAETSRSGIKAEPSSCRPAPGLVQAGPAPVEPAKAAEVVATTKSATIDRSFQILLAEDNVVNQTVAIQMLKRLGHGADVAGDGVKATEMAAAKTYDLILMDIQMPELDGVEAMRCIRKLSSAGERRPRIVALTANAVEGDREHYLNEGMDGYLAKPMQLADLAAVIDEAVALAAVVPPARAEVQVAS